MQRILHSNNILDCANTVQIQTYFWRKTSVGPLYVEHRKTYTYWMHSQACKFSSVWNYTCVVCHTNTGNLTQKWPAKDPPKATMDENFNLRRRNFSKGILLLSIRAAPYIKMGNHFLQTRVASLGGVFALLISPENIPDWKNFLGNSCNQYTQSLHVITFYSLAACDTSWRQFYTQQCSI